MKKRIEEKLIKAFNPHVLEVVNNSKLHKGHLGDDGSGETHFAIKISSEEFEDLSRINIHRKINKELREEFDRGLHALEIEVIK
jgi:BolA family transcriptional regulator, general stress-responsive regulator